jgi:hypothetical protein
VQVWINSLIETSKWAEVSEWTSDLCHLLRLFPDLPATFENTLGYRHAPTGGIHEARDKAWSSAAEL